MEHLIMQNKSKKLFNEIPASSSWLDPIGEFFCEGSCVFTRPLINHVIPCSNYILWEKLVK